MIFLVLAMCGSAAISLTMKAFRAQRGNRYGMLLGNYITCVIVGFLMLGDPGLLLRGSVTSLVLGVIGGVFFVANLVSMQSSIRQNGAGLSAAFAKLGLVVTLGVSVLCFGERATPMQLAGIALVFAALLLIHGGGGKAGENRSFLLLLLVLFTGGAGDVMSKVFDELGTAAEGTLFFFWLFLTACLLTSALALREKRRTGAKLLWKELASGILVGIPNYFSSYWLLLALGSLPAVLVYPVASTGTILLVMAASALLFHEKLTRRQLAGILLILAALVLLNIG